MTTIVYDRSVSDHQLPAADLAAVGCLFIIPVFGTVRAITKEELQNAAVVCVHAGDDLDYKTGMDVLKSGKHLAYFSADEHRANRHTVELRKLFPTQVGLVHWIRLERLRQDLGRAIAAGDLSTLYERERPNAADTLAGLAILCQGYLATHAVKEAPEQWGPREIRDVLTEIGWVDLMKTAAGARWSGLSVHAQRTANPAWWREALDQKEELDNCLRDETLGEYPEGMPVLARLVEAIFAAENITPRIVGLAYRCLAGRLKAAMEVKP
jgi:hypothetical protein